MQLVNLLMVLMAFTLGPVFAGVASFQNGAHMMEKRDDFIGVECKKFQQARCGTIRSGLGFLDGRSAVRIPARTKSRVSCSYNTGIYYENGEDFEVVVPAKVIADQVRQLFDKCQTDCRSEQSFSGRSIFQRHQIYVAGTGEFGESC